MNDNKESLPIRLSAMLHSGIQPTRPQLFSLVALSGLSNKTSGILRLLHFSLRYSSPVPPGRAMNPMGVAMFGVDTWPKAHVQAERSLADMMKEEALVLAVPCPDHNSTPRIAC